MIAAAGVGAAVLLISGCGSDTTAQVSNSGFEVATNGFSFKNYGNDGQDNLTAGEMSKLFGEVVCARGNGSSCVLTPTAKQWMDKVNDSMSGGHCFGMAGLSWALFKNDINPQTFGGPNAASLKLTGNQALQTALAGVMATQYTEPTKSAKVPATPNDVLTKLKEAWGKGAGYTFAIYRLVGGEQQSGHAITPISISDAGDGKTAINVYDNNFPSAPQKVTVDTAANTWTYSTAADPKNDPQVYTGTGTTNQIELYPVAPMIKPQKCPFCMVGAIGSDEGGIGSVASEDAAQGDGGFNMVYLNQAAFHRGVSLNVTAPDGGEIPGLQTFSPLAVDGNPTISDLIYVPQDQQFKVQIDGTELRKPAATDVSIIGPGYGYTVDEIDINPGETEDILFTPDKYMLTYETSLGAAPDIALTLEGEDVSYGFLFGGLQLGKKGGKIDVSMDPAKQTVTASGGGSGDATIDFSLERVSETSDESYSSDAIPLAKNETIIIDYGKWKGDGKPMPVGIDKNNDGDIDEKLIQPDE